MEMPIITKREIKRAIKFLDTLPDEAWTVREQTKNDDPAFIGKCHCAIGHLSVNPKSPFYKKEFLCYDGTTTGPGDDDFGCMVNNLAKLKLGVYLSEANNGRPGIKYTQPTPKERSIALLNDLLN